MSPVEFVLYQQTGAQSLCVCLCVCVCVFVCVCQ